MSATPCVTMLCRYHYDPLDRLIDCAPSAEAGIQRFYCKSRLATEIQGTVQRSVFQHDDQLLAQLRRENTKVDTTLLATDHQRSVLNALNANRLHPLAYTPYGHRPAENGLLSLLGFNGERPDPVTGHYLLGNGYRAFNPVLMRFNSPDSLSPFGEGGLNAYAYCLGNPINLKDPTGHIPKLAAKWFDSIFENTFLLMKDNQSKDVQLAALMKKTEDLFGGAKKLERLAADKGVHPDIIVASALSDPIKEAPPLKTITPTDDINKYLYQADKHLRELLINRDASLQLSRSGELYNLSEANIMHLRLKTILYNNELERSVNYLLKFRKEGPSPATYFIAEEWAQSVRITN